MTHYYNFHIGGIKDIPEMHRIDIIQSFNRQYKGTIQQLNNSGIK